MNEITLDRMFDQSGIGPGSYDHHSCFPTKVEYAVKHHLTNFRNERPVHRFSTDKKHNPSLKIGKLTIQHVKFKQIGEDENGYPINEHYNGEPILDEIKMYEVPYLKDEVNSLIMWLKDNK